MGRGETPDDRSGRKSVPSRQEPPTTSHISYFARLSDAATFSDQASGEIRPRGVERAQEVAAVTDGAEWISGFVRSHRADALHILDFAHAAGYVHAIKEAIEASGVHIPAKWEEGVLHRLKHAGPQRVLAHLAFLSQHFAAAPMGEALQFLQKRREHMQYPHFRQQGWPIGSGMVESGNKVVIQARLKGAGMHWRRENVNPMLALRMALCNERWPESWHAQHHVRTQQRQQHRLTRQQHRQQQQQAALAQLLLALLAASPPLSAPAEPAPVPQQSGRTATQYRWGRQTFSPRMLQQGGYAKKSPAPLSSVYRFFGAFSWYTYGMSTKNHARTTESDDTCVMEQIMGRTLCLIGDKWTLLIVYSLMSGARRFGELLEALRNISPKTLSQRLKMLEDVKFVDRHAYMEIPPRVEYSLTEKGEALVDILKAIQEFGEKYLSDVDEHHSEGCE